MCIRPGVKCGIPHEYGSTAYGVLNTIIIASKHARLDLKGATVAIDGFGNVGSSLAKFLVDYGVMGTPTLIFFCGGRPLMHLVGFASEQELRRVVNDMLGRHRSCLMQSTELKSYVV